MFSIVLLILKLVKRKISLPAFKNRLLFQKNVNIQGILVNIPFNFNMYFPSEIMFPLLAL